MTPFHPKHYRNGVMVIDAPQAQGANGALKAAGPVSTRDLSITTDLELGSVVVVALDGQPLASSSRMLLQVMSEEKAAGFATEPAGDGLKRIVSIGRDPWMVRDLASHLDEGLATDPHRQRRAGLYELGRNWQRPGRRYLGGLPSTLQLPEDATDAALLVLDALGVPVDRYEAYVARVLQHLPSWAGMVHWRETHPEYGARGGSPSRC